jgi:hypothetical protein
MKGAIGKRKQVKGSEKWESWSGCSIEGWKAVREVSHGNPPGTHQDQH